jgi:hypothetical protein
MQNDKREQGLTICTYLESIRQKHFLEVEQMLVGTWENL